MREGLNTDQMKPMRCERKMVEVRGFEPLTYTLRTYRSPN